ncbi:putative PurR-regulated permease PerM [Rhodoligotrophos appendicifer]|uniref:AI-2E family transporter n=1 Tax=Rhodoligotrophos appendicifer TaxID=987056 RepID=UPI001180EC97|nr:AI-2E family transporter [Rhodoligotrophos appendicifer]
MVLHRQMIFWIAALVAMILMLYIFSTILLPFIAGFAIAYFLDPVADWLQRRGMNRLAATFTILLLFILLIVVVALSLVPTLSEQLSGLAQKLPDYIKSLIDLYQRVAPDWLKDVFTSPDQQQLTSNLSDVASKGAGWLATILSSLWSGGMAVINIVSLLVITPIVVFYMLNDWDRMVAMIDALLPRGHVETIRGLAREMDRAVAGFIRGQGTVCLVLGSFYAAALTAAGLSFGLLIGITAGILSFIPYVGSITGFVLSIGMALVQFWPEWTMVLVVFGIFVFGQFVEGNFLQPVLVGDRVGLHPVWLMFALFAFGYLFGFAGLLLAVPLAACVGVLVRFAVRRYRESPLYLEPDTLALATGEQGLPPLPPSKSVVQITHGEEAR